ncbi:hypothetical protein FJ936_09130 [Mesorhizobium sp. B2-4-13]|nr:hypothetical protein FJ936_09130 [Mesorhizobium sp. B2-4-13]
MMTHERLDHRFVESFPERLQEGILYISTEYASMTHLCACGCGSEVVTPLSPLDWRFMFDGQTISVHPSIGSWSLPCRSHYIIRHNQIHWAEDWSDEQIAAGRTNDLAAKRGPVNSPASRTPDVAEVEQPRDSKPLGFFGRVKKWIFR